MCASKITTPSGCFTSVIAHWSGTRTIPGLSSVGCPRAPSRNVEKLSFELAAYCTRAESDTVSDSAGTRAVSSATVVIDTS
jgi:hypothetical protein